MLPLGAIRGQGLRLPSESGSALHGSDLSTDEQVYQSFQSTPGSWESGKLSERGIGPAGRHEGARVAFHTEWSYQATSCTAEATIQHFSPLVCTSDHWGGDSAALRDRELLCTGHGLHTR